MKNIIYIAALFVLSIQINATTQISLTDSLETALMQHTADDTMKVSLLNQLSKANFNSDIEKARDYARMAGELSDRIGYMQGKYQSQYNTALVYTKSNLQEALIYFNNALAIAKEENNIQNMATCRNSIGTCYTKMGDYEKGIDNYIKSIGLAKIVDDKKLQAKALSNMAIIYRHMSNNAKVEECYIAAIELYKELDCKLEIANCNNLLANVYEIQGNFPMATECIQKSLEIFEMLDNKKGLSVAYISLGGLFFNQKEYNKAIEYNTRALKIAEEDGLDYNNATCLLNIGMSLMELNNPEAEKYLERALEYAVKLNNSSFKIATLVALGKYECILNQYDIAKKYYLEALDLAQSKKTYISISEIKCELANIYFKNGDYSTSLSYAQQALELSEGNKAVKVQKEVHKLMADIYSATQKYKEAFEHSVMFKTLSDSIFNESNAIEVARFEYKHKYEKEKQIFEIEQSKKDAVMAAELKQQKIIIIFSTVALVLMILLSLLLFRSYRTKRKSNIMLANKNERIIAISNELERQNIELQNINATKNKFFRIIAHDLRNPLNVIIGFLDLIKDSSSNNIMQQTLEYAELTHSSAVNAYKLLENLLDWAQSQTGVIEFKPTELRLSDVINESISTCCHQAKEKSIEIIENTSCDEYVYADKNMLDTIIRNLITNAIKYTHKGGNINITNQLNDNSITVSISDNGIGMDNDTMERLFKINEKTSMPGTEQEHGTGLGLLLCKEFVERNGGSIWVESELNVGSSFKFTMPIVN